MINRLCELRGVDFRHGLWDLSDSGMDDLFGRRDDRGPFLVSVSGSHL